MDNNLSIIMGQRLIHIGDVSNATGLSRSTLTNIYYRKATNVQLSTLMKICDFFQISLSELINYDPGKEVK